MPDLLPKGKIIHTPPKTAVHLQKLTNGSKSYLHITRQIPHHLAGQEGNMQSLHAHRGTEHNSLPTHTPCFCSLQKWAVKDHQYSFLRQEGKGSWMQIFLGRRSLGDGGSKTSPMPKKPPLGFRDVLAHFFPLFNPRDFLVWPICPLYPCSQQNLVQKVFRGSAARNTRCHSYFVVFSEITVFYFSIRKITFKISKSLNIEHEEQTMFQVSCTFLQKPEGGPDFLPWLRTEDSYCFCQYWFLPRLVSSLREKLSTKCQAELGNRNSSLL